MKNNKILRKITALAGACIIASTAFFLPVDAAKKFNMSYIYFGDQSSYVAYVERTKDGLNEIAPSYFDIDKDGSLKPLDKINTYFIKEMHKKGIKVIPFLSNHWDREAGRLALQNREQLVEDLVQAIKEYDLDGINVDIENVTEEDKDAYTDLVKLLREELPRGKSVSVAVAANPYGLKKGWQASYDYEKLAKYSDYLMIMAYDESYQGGPAGPVASLGFVERSVQYALKHAPADKIVLGLPFFGRYWKDGESYGGYGMSLEKAKDLMAKYPTEVTYDERSHSPMAKITVRAEDPKSYVFGKEMTPGTYTLWYENDASLKEKIRLVQKYDLKGAGSWSLGQETSDTWNYFNLWLNGKYFIDTVGHWAEDAILSMEDRGWMKGISSTNFAPDQSLNRAQAAVTLVRALGLEGETDENSFEDVSQDHWAKEEIEIAKEAGIIEGMDEDRFAPEEPITREQMATMLERILTELEDEEEQEVAFSDVDEEDWSYGAVMKMAGHGIFEGYPDGKFQPRAKITRGQMAALMDRIAKYIEEK